MMDVSPDKSPPRNAPSEEQDESVSRQHGGHSLSNRSVLGKEPRKR